MSNYIKSMTTELVYKVFGTQIVYGQIYFIIYSNKEWRMVSAKYYKPYIEE